MGEGLSYQFRRGREREKKNPRVGMSRVVALECKLHGRNEGVKVARLRSFASLRMTIQEKANPRPTRKSGVLGTRRGGVISFQL